MPYKDPQSKEAKASMAKRNKRYYEKHKAERLEYTKAKNKRYYEENRERLCRESREWSKNNRDKKKEHANNYKTKYPEKLKAQSYLRSAVRSGKIKKKPCIVCGSKTVEAHHPDYKEPLEVVWLCDKHHKSIHRLMRANK